MLTRPSAAAEKSGAISVHGPSSSGFPVMPWNLQLSNTGARQVRHQLQPSEVRVDELAVREGGAIEVAIHESRRAKRDVGDDRARPGRTTQVGPEPVATGDARVVEVRQKHESAAEPRPVD